MSWLWRASTCLPFPYSLDFLPLKLSGYEIVVSYDTVMQLAVRSISEYIRAGEEKHKRSLEEIEKAKRTKK